LRLTKKIAQVVQNPSLLHRARCERGLFYSVLLQARGAILKGFCAERHSKLVVARANHHLLRTILHRDFAQLLLFLKVFKSARSGSLV
jgi:hypothetical protein